MFPQLFYKTLYGNKDPSDDIRDLHKFQMASIDGYQRLCVYQAAYPGITPATGRTVSGYLVTGLTAANLQKMDKYEGGQYDRKPLTIKLSKMLGTGKVVSDGTVVADAYIFKYPHVLEKKEW
jgi:hypothetical protein